MMTSWERIPVTFAEIGYTAKPGPMPTHCWIWNGTTNEGGYGLLYHLRAHRVSYEIVHGGIPDGLLIRHLCHVRACVNPAHLAPGTHAENTNDAREADRLASGERSPHAKVTDAQVGEMRALVAVGIRQKDVAARYGITQSAVSMIVRGHRRTSRNTPRKEQSK